MSFATDFEIGFSTKQALRDKAKLEKALDSIARKAEQTGKRMDRALGRGGAKAVKNLRGVATSIDRASASTRNMERNLRGATQQSRKLAIQQRAVLAATRTAAKQSIALGGAGAAAGVGGATAATTAGATAGAAANKKLASSFSSVAAGATAARAALLPLGVAAVAVFGTGVATRSAVKFADEIAKTGRRLGLTTDSLQELRFAADLSGISSQQMTSALEAMGKRIGEARQQTGTLVTFLGKFDPALLEAVKAAKDGKEQFLLVADAFEKMSDSSDKAALSAAFYGRGAGSVLINLLSQGRDAIEGYAQQAHNLGLVLGGDILTNSEKLNDEFSITSQVTARNFQRAMIQAGPAVDGLAQGLLFLSVGLRRVIDDFRDLENKTLLGVQEDFAKNEKGIAFVVNRMLELDKKIAAGGGIYGGIFGTGGLEKELKRVEAVFDTLVKKRDELQAELAKPSRTLGSRLSGAAPAGGAPDPLGAEGADEEATRIKTLIDRLTRERVTAERSITTATATEAQKRRAAIAFQFVDAVKEAKGNAEAVAAAQSAFVQKTGAFNAQLAKKTVKAEKTLTDEILELLNKRVTATAKFGEVQEEVTRLIDEGTLSTEQGARALNEYAEGLGLVDARAKAATERLEGMGKALTGDVLGSVSEALVDFDFSSITESLFAANRQLLVGFVQEGLRPVLGKAFEGLAEAAGPTTPLGKVFSGAAEEAFGGTGATVGEDLIIEAIKEQTKVIQGGTPGVSGATRRSSSGGRVIGGGPGISGSIPDGLTVKCVCECECCCCCDAAGGGQGRSSGGRNEAASEALEQGVILAERREAQIEKVDNTVWDSAERTQRKIAELTTETRFGFSNMIQKSAQLLSDLPDLFGTLATAIVLGLTPKGPSTTDKVLGIIGAVAKAASSASSGAGGGGGGTVSGARGGVIGRTHFPTSRVSASVFNGAPRFQSGGVVPVLAHSGELITPLEGGRLPVIMNNGVPEVRTPGGDRVPVDIRGERDVGPVIFGAGAIVVMASPGERLDQTVGQAVEKAFIAGARQQRRNQGRTA